MKGTKLFSSNRSRVITHATLGARQTKHDDSINKTDYTKHCALDLDAIRLHLRNGKLPIQRIAQMYGLPVEHVQKIDKELWDADPAYRLLRARK